MKSVILTCAIALAATSAFAGATYSLKGDSANDTNGNGNLVGTYSSSGTGNGGVVGGNGTAYDGVGRDQTTFPGSRAQAVHSLGVGGAASDNNGWGQK